MLGEPANGAWNTIPVYHHGIVPLRSVFSTSQSRRAPPPAATFDTAGFYRIGDRGCWVDGDHLVVNRRIKDLIIRNGENISPEENRGSARGSSGHCRNRHRRGAGRKDRRACGGGDPPARGDDARCCRAGRLPRPERGGAVHGSRDGGDVGSVAAERCGEGLEGGSSRVAGGVNATADRARFRQF